MKLRSIALVLLVAALPASSRGETAPDDPKASAALELAAVKKTQGLLAGKYRERKAELTTRVRAMYKLSRASWPRIWFEPEIRQSASRWLGAARRITRRDIAELALLKNEMAITDRDEERLVARQGQGLAVSEDRALAWPVEDTKILSAFGDHRGPSRRVRLRRRGVLLRSRVGARVTAPAAGRVRYVGTISGLGSSLIIEHGPALAPSGVTILGGLQAISVQVGKELSAGEAIAAAAAAELYLEHRSGTLSASWPVDPEPLLTD